MARSRLSPSRPAPLNRIVANAICATIKPWRRLCAARLGVPPRVSDWIALVRWPRRLNHAMGTASASPMMTAPTSATDARRVSKAMSLGAKAVLIGRPYYWGLAAFGQVGVQRVIEMLRGEMMVAMGQSGIPNLASFDRSLVEFLPGTRTVLE